MYLLAIGYLESVFAFQASKIYSSYNLSLYNKGLIKNQNTLSDQRISQRYI